LEIIGKRDASLSADGIDVQCLRLLGGQLCFVELERLYQVPVSVDADEHLGLRMDIRSLYNPARNL
jgi:hypothetical protein